MSNREYPDDFDYEDGNTCRFCDNKIMDGKDYCSRECFKADIDENC